MCKLPIEPRLLQVGLDTTVKHLGPDVLAIDVLELPIVGDKALAQWDHDLAIEVKRVRREEIWVPLLWHHGDHELAIVEAA